MLATDAKIVEKKYFVLHLTKFSINTNNEVVNNEP